MPTEQPLSTLALRDYTPKAMVRLPEHHPTRFATPVVDVHNHLGRWHRGTWYTPSVPDLLQVMDECNVGTIVNLDGCWEQELEDNLDRYDRAYPGRFLTFTAIWSWNDLLWPLIVNTDPEKMPVSAGLATLQGEHLTNYPVLMAGALLASLPMIALFVLFQRHVLQGIAFTGLKG